MHQRYGPMIEPCGTEDMTLLCLVSIFSPIFTWKVRFCKYDLTKLKTLFGRNLSFSRRVS